MFASDLEAKRIELLHDLAPNSGAFAVLVDSTLSTAPFTVEQVQAAGRKLGVPIRIVSVGGDRNYLGAFAAVAREKVGAMLVTASTKFNAARIAVAMQNNAVRGEPDELARV
jgi:putative tryptophan/tyrosine transport system substrate-binding protein